MLKFTDMSDEKKKDDYTKNIDIYIKDVKDKINMLNISSENDQITWEKEQGSSQAMRDDDFDAGYGEIE